MIDIITVIWVLDILNIIPILDTTYPINTVAWIFIWVMLSSSRESKKEETKK